MNLAATSRLSGVAVSFLLLSGCGSGVGSETAVPPPPSETITITTNPFIQCVQSVPFSLTLKAQGNSGPVTWSVSSGQMAAGLTLDSQTGIISGTPISSSGETVNIQAADARANSIKQFNFVVFTKLVINPVTPANAHLNAPYSQTIAAQASSAIASWTISAGQLPPGLTVATSDYNLDTAIISGIPTQLGTYNFTIQAQDYTIPQITSVALTIIIDSHVALTKSSLQNGGQNQIYSDTFTAIDGSPPYQWSIAGILPSGISMNSSTGKVTGTPTDFGSFSYTVTVTDSSNPLQSDSAQNALYIAQQLQIFTNIGNANINSPFNSSFYAIGGTYPYVWSVISGSLPPGLGLYPNGVVQGTPTQLGSFPFVIQATDSGKPPYVVSHAVTLNVTPTPLTMNGAPLSPAPVNVPYLSQIPASGGTPPYFWTTIAGSLPPGLTLEGATGFINGTPSQSGTYNFQVQGTDSSSPPQTTTAFEFIVIRPGLGRNDSIATATPLGNSQTQPLVFSISPYIDPINASIPNPDNDFYKLVASGGSIVHVETFAQRSWGVNPLDSVIELLDQNGARLASCTQPAYASPCLNDDLDSTTRDSALDFRVPGGANGTATFYIHVFDWRGDARPDMLYYLNISGVIEPLKISQTTLAPGATRGVNFQQQFTTTGGTGNIMWVQDGGQFPPGWTLSSAGLLSGVATTDGFYTFAVKATDSANPPQTARAQYTMQIAEPLVITSSPLLPTVCVNKSYTFKLQTSGGVPPIFYGFYSPSWVSINFDATTGIFSGMTSVTGTFMGTVGAGDSAQPSSGQTQQVTLTVVTCP